MGMKSHPAEGEQAPAQKMVMRCMHTEQRHSCPSVEANCSESKLGSGNCVILNEDNCAFAHTLLPQEQSDHCLHCLPVISFKNTSVTGRNLQT